MNRKLLFLIVFSCLTTSYLTQAQLLTLRDIHQLPQDERPGILDIDLDDLKRQIKKVTIKHQNGRQEIIAYGSKPTEHHQAPVLLQLTAHQDNPNKYNIEIGNPPAHNKFVKKLETVDEIITFAQLLNYLTTHPSVEEQDTSGGHRVRRGCVIS